MSRRVSISMRAARNISTAAKLGCNPDAWALEELRRAMEPKRKARKPAQRSSPELMRAFKTLLPSRKPSKEEKREETSQLWNAALARSGNQCECGCGRFFQEEGPNKPEMDHQASRRVPQTLQNVWMLALACHRLRQRNNPSERYWLDRFLARCLRHGYTQEARRVEDRIAVVETKTTLPASPGRKP